jgi:hypothetical protein
MANPKSKAASHIDQKFNDLADLIRNRYNELKTEMDDLLKTLERAAEKPSTAKIMNAKSGGGAAVNAATATPKAKKRIRLPGVDVEWIAAHLNKKPHTLKQLQDVAEKEGKSPLSVMNMLRENKAKFKASEGTKEKGQKGKAPQVWTVK